MISKTKFSEATESSVVFTSSNREISSFALAPSSLKALLAAGFRKVSDLEGLKCSEIASEASITPKEALEVVKTLRSSSSDIQASISLDKPPSTASDGKTAYELLAAYHAKRPIPTFSADLDHILGGGVHLGEVTEFCGESGVGKTQLGIQLACNVQLPKAFDGVEGEAVIIDTEGSFVPSRAHDMAKAMIDHLSEINRENPAQEFTDAIKSMSPQMILSKIHFIRCKELSEQIAAVRQIPILCRNHPKIKLVIVDSVAFHFRHAFGENISQRARLLAEHALHLSNLAINNGLAVVVINQVTTKIKDSSSFLAPALGETWQHTATHRLLLHWRSDVRFAYVEKSSYLPEQSAPYEVVKAGIRSVSALQHAADKSLKRPMDSSPPQYSPQKPQPSPPSAIPPHTPMSRQSIPAPQNIQNHAPRIQVQKQSQHHPSTPHTPNQQYNPPQQSPYHSNQGPSQHNHPQQPFNPQYQYNSPQFLQQQQLPHFQENQMQYQPQQFQQQAFQNQQQFVQPPPQQYAQSPANFSRQPRPSNPN